MKYKRFVSADTLTALAASCLPARFARNRPDRQRGGNGPEVANRYEVPTSESGPGTDPTRPELRLAGRWARGAGYALLVSLAACSGGGAAGWVEPRYDNPKPPVTPNEGTIQGLTILVSFSGQGETITDAHARKLQRMLLSDNYGDDGNQGSVREYLRDMSNDKLKLQSQVVRVTLPNNFAYYDKDEPDVITADNVQSIDQVKVTGPATKLLEDALKSLVTVNGTPPSYDVVTESSITRRTNDFDFGTLSTAKLSFWPDYFIRVLTGDGNIQSPSIWMDFLSIPNIDTFRYVNVIFAGKSLVNKSQRGLWPRSIPAIGVPLPNGAPSAKFARFHIAGTLPPWSTTNTPLPADVASHTHETMHTVLGLPDLYDSGPEFGLGTGWDEPKSSGVHQHDPMGNTIGEKNVQILGAPLRDRLGWAQVKDISDFSEGTTVSLAANSGETARYCRPLSSAVECYYIEARSRAVPRGRSGRPATMPDEGLVIWHTEDSKNLLDTSVNNKREGTAAQHYQIAVVEADGKGDLNANRAAGPGDYFRKGGVDRFDAASSPSSQWWDGTPSGLSIRNVSAPGATMTFEIGRRPLARVHVETDPNVEVLAGDKHLRVGQQRVVTFRGKAGYLYDVSIAGMTTLERKRLSGNQTQAITGTMSDTHIKVLSYPSAPTSPSFQEVQVNASLTEGVELVTIGAGRTRAPGGRLFDAPFGRISLLPGATIGYPETFLRLRTYPSQPRARVIAKAQPGYVLRYLKALSPTDAVPGGEALPHAYASQLTADVIAPADRPPGAFHVVANAEPLPGYLCRAGFIETWSLKKNYENIGDKVRWGDFIYVSNLPRNVMPGPVQYKTRNFVSTAQDNPDYLSNQWSRIASCAPFVEDCSAAPEWKPGTKYTAGTSRFRFNGALYEGKAGFMAGSSASYQEQKGAQMYGQVDPTYPIHDNRAFVSVLDSNIKVIGNCSDPQYWKRAVIVPSSGVATITQSTGTAVQEHPTLPRFVTNLNADWSFSFSLEPGFELDDVYIDGQKQGLASSARTARVTFPKTAAAQKPAYIEIKTRCNNGICARTSGLAVSCKLGTLTNWGAGFQVNATVTNTSSATINNWRVGVLFGSPPSLWDSANVKYQLEGNSAIFSNAEAWNGLLAPNQTYTFSVSGPISGPFVPPTCTGL